MLFITGDTHGEKGRLLSAAHQNGERLTEKDYLAVCGDFGFLFSPKGTMAYIEQQCELDELEALPYTILFVDGNHENFDLLEALPIEEWRGGRIHRVRKNIIHLMRGEIYEIEGKRVLAMGGGCSIDRAIRLEGYSYWERELPSNEEYRYAAESLFENAFAVDVILSHTAPREIICRMGRTPDPHEAELCDFLEWILYETEFKKWYFGHWHTDGEITRKVRAIYTDIVVYED